MDPSLYPVSLSVLDKLLILNYTPPPTQKLKKPLTAAFLCFPSKQIADQWSAFIQLTNYLFQKCKVESEWTEFDDPNTVVSSIIENARKLQYPHELNPTKLRNGHGDQVVQLLDYLTTLALRKQNFNINPVSYENFQTQETVEQEENDEEIEEPEIEETFDPEDDEIQKIDQQQPDESHTVITSSVSAKEWAEEVERVSSKLRVKTDVTATSEWRNHLNEAKLQIEKLKISQIAPLTKLSETLNSQLENIAEREKVVNRDYKHLQSSFEGVNIEYQAVAKKFEELNSEIAELDQELNNKNALVEKYKNEMNSVNAAMTDMTPLKLLTAALNSIKEQIRRMDVKIGIVQQTNAQMQIKQEMNKRKARDDKIELDEDED